MARIRSIKPSFWTNEVLAELSPWHRLCFIGLWKGTIYMTPAQSGDSHSAGRTLPLNGCRGFGLERLGERPVDGLHLGRVLVQLPRSAVVFVRLQGFPGNRQSCQ